MLSGVYAGVIRTKLHLPSDKFPWITPKGNLCIQNPAVWAAVDAKRQEQHRHRPQMAFPKKQSVFCKKHEASAFFASSQVLTYHWCLRQQIMNEKKLGDQVAAAAKSSSKEKGSSGPPRAAQKRNQEVRQAWKRRRQRHARAARKGNHEGSQAWEPRRQRQPWRQAWETRRQRQPRAELMKGDKLGKQRRQRQPKAQNGDHEGRQVWQTRRQRQPRAPQNRKDHEGRQAWETRRQRHHDYLAISGDQQPSHSKVRGPIVKGNKLGRQGGSGSQEQPRRKIMKGDKFGGQGARPAHNGNRMRQRHHELRNIWRQFGRQGRNSPEWRSWRGTSWAAAAPRKEIMKGDKRGREGGSGSQEQPRMEIMKGGKLGRQGGGGIEEQPRMEIMKADKLGKQGGSGITTIWRFRGSATRPLRSKNPYSLELSGEQKQTN